MKTIEQIKKLAEDFTTKDNAHYHYRGKECFVRGYVDGYIQSSEDMSDKKYTEEDMINASKYGYEFRDTTSFPEHKFEDSCINNTKQWLEWYNNKQ